MITSQQKIIHHKFSSSMKPSIEGDKRREQVGLFSKTTQKRYNFR